MNAHRFILQPYKGVATRHTCPACHKKRCFSRYIDTEKQISFPDDVGRCDHEQSCGYNLTPKEYFERNPQSKPQQRDFATPSAWRAKPTEQRKPTSFIAAETVKQTLHGYEKNNLYLFLRSKFGAEDALRLMKEYRVGTSKHWPGSCVFWQTDINSRVRAGKVMLYNADIPMVMVSSLVLLAFGSAVWLGGPERIISRADGIVLLLLFAIFMRLTFARAHDGCGSDIGASDEAASKPPMPMWKAVVWTLVGLGALVGGGNWFVDGASGIASSLGVSDAIIGLTVVAVGTSLPELATTIIAALKGMPGLAIGNVIGSNIFNIFLVLGVSAVVRPLPFGGVTQIDLLVLTGASLLFWIVGRFFRDRTITRSEGALMILLYIAYTIYLIATL